MATLSRRPKSGFILYPKDADKRIVDGSARYRTKCDVLVGPCACGAVHQEDDEWVQDLLHDYNHTLAPFILHWEFDGRVLMPRYWRKPRFHDSCDTLQGRCRCGTVHNCTEAWIIRLLSIHNTIIDNSPIPQSAGVSEDEEFTNIEVEGTFPDCNCDSCQQRRREAGGRRILDRREI
jgi:hypothetical protein